MGIFVSALGNPWRKAEFNLTLQAKFVEKYGQRRADQFAADADNLIVGFGSSFTRYDFGG